MEDNRPPLDRQTAAALLEWYVEAGIDVFVSNRPRDRFAETAAEVETRAVGREARREAPPQDRDAAPAAPAAALPARPAPAASAPPPGRSDDAQNGPFPSLRVAVPDEIAIADARERARSAASLDELRQALESFEGCNLRVTASSLVFGDGNPDADLMLIGEAPGREEDRAGLPFVGRSGQLLNRMLAAIGVERESVRVTNTVPWRPPGNRPPTPAETEICRPFIARQIELVRPKILVCLGSPAAKVILRTDEGILRIRGRWQTYAFGLTEEEALPVMAMLHPAYLLRQPAQKRLAWRDLLAVKARLDGMKAAD